MHIMSSSIVTLHLNQVVRHRLTLRDRENERKRERHTHTRAHALAHRNTSNRERNLYRKTDQSFFTRPPTTTKPLSNYHYTVPLPVPVYCLEETLHLPVHVNLKALAKPLKLSKTTVL